MEEDGIVETVDETFHDNAQHGGSFLTNFSLLGFIESNGWFILIGAVVLYYLYTQYEKRQREQSSSNAKKDLSDERTVQHALAIEEARLRQQAAFEAAKLKYLEEKRLKEEKLAKERAEEWEKHQQGLGYHSKTKKQELSREEELKNLGLGSLNKDKKPRLRGTDYNPLTGSSSTGSSGGSCSFRPGRGGPARGG